VSKCFTYIIFNSHNSLAIPYKYFHFTNESAKKLSNYITSQVCLDPNLVFPSLVNKEISESCDFSRCLTGNYRHIESEGECGECFGSDIFLKTNTGGCFHLLPAS
jgi:hypothetical protein